jgi:hypothetical protein
VNPEQDIKRALQEHWPHKNGAGYWICECGHALPGQDVYEGHLAAVVVGVLTANGWALRRASECPEECSEMHRFTEGCALAVSPTQKEPGEC